MGNTPHIGLKVVLKDLSSTGNLAEKDCRTLKCSGQSPVVVVDGVAVVEVLIVEKYVGEEDLRCSQCQCVRSRSGSPCTL